MCRSIADSAAAICRKRSGKGIRIGVTLDGHEFVQMQESERLRDVSLDMIHRHAKSKEKVCGNEASENRRDRGGEGCQSKSTKSIPCIAVHIMHNNPDNDPSSHWFRREVFESFEASPSRSSKHMRAGDAIYGVSRIVCGEAKST
jgi:hypothetical protein